MSLCARCGTDDKDKEGRCRLCRNKWYRERYRRNIEKIKIRGRIYTASHKEDIRNRNVAYRQKHLERLKQQGREWGRVNKKHVSASKKRYYQKNRALLLIRAAERRKLIRSDPDKHLSFCEKLWERSLVRNYGFDSTEYFRRLSEQKGVCFLCHQTEKSRIKGKLVRMVVDHCHRTGAVRKILCNRCNKVLGFVEDNANLLRRMADYLEEHATPAPAQESTTAEAVNA